MVFWTDIITLVLATEMLMATPIKETLMEIRMDYITKETITVVAMATKMKVILTEWATVFTTKEMKMEKIMEIKM